MNCQQIDKYIYEFCDNRLTPQMQDGIKAHLEHCESCRDKVAAARCEGNLLRSMETIPPLQPDFTMQVMSLIQGNLSRRRANRFAWNAYGFTRRFRWWWGAASAAVLILAICSLSLLEQPVGIRLAEQADRGSVQTETLPAALNSIQEKSPKPEETQAAEVKEPVMEPVKESAQEPPTRFDRVALQDSQATAPPYDSALKRASQPVPSYRSAATTAAPNDQVVKSTPPTYPNRGVELLTLHPTNLPPEYLLQAVISNSDQDITFVFQNQVTQQELNLRLTAVNNQTDNLDIQDSTSDTPFKTDSANDSEGLGGSSPTEDLIINSYQSNMNYNQHHYQLVVTGNLSTEELATIAKSIKLEEEITDDKQENP